MKIIKRLKGRQNKHPFLKVYRIIIKTTYRTTRLY